MAARKSVLPEWVRLVRDTRHPPPGGAPVRVRAPEDVGQTLAWLRDELVEVFVVLCLDSQSRITQCQEMTRGLLDSALVHPREVFRVAIAAGAAGIIVAHNHPSGDATPSPEDRAVTRGLVEAGRLLDIPLYDHVILAGPQELLSMAEAGLL